MHIPCLKSSRGLINSVRAGGVRFAYRTFVWHRMSMQQTPFVYYRCAKEDRYLIYSEKLIGSKIIHTIRYLKPKIVLQVLITRRYIGEGDMGLSCWNWIGLWLLPLVNIDIIYTTKPKLSDSAMEVYVCQVRVGFPVKMHYDQCRTSDFKRITKTALQSVIFIIKSK